MAFCFSVELVLVAERFGGLQCYPLIPPSVLIFCWFALLRLLLLLLLLVDQRFVHPLFSSWIPCLEC